MEPFFALSEGTRNVCGGESCPVSLAILLSATKATYLVSVILRGDIAKVGREARPNDLGRPLALDVLVRQRIVAGRGVEEDRLVALVLPENGTSGG